MYKLQSIPLRTAITITIHRHIRPQTPRFLSAAPLETMSAISNAVKKDHKEIRAYYNNIINAKDNDEATRWQNQFTWELARHAIAEELVVYPSFIKTLGEQGKQMSDKDRAAHQTVRSLHPAHPFHSH
jgi:hypothetical protein